MGEVILRSDTKATEFGRLTAIDLELNSVILELIYLTCLTLEYGPSAGKKYLYEYDATVVQIHYENPIDIFAYLANVPKKSVQWILDRTLFFREEKAKRQAEADKKTAEAEKEYAQADKIRQSAIEKKLKNLEFAHRLRQKLLKDGTHPDEAALAISGLLQDQRAKLLIPDSSKTA